MQAGDFGGAQEEDLARILGASSLISAEPLRIYIPDTDKEGQEIDAITWARRAFYLLGGANGLADGATLLPAADGLWKGRPERTIIAYAYLPFERLLENAAKLQAFIQVFGRETRLDAVMIEYRQTAYFFTNFDTAG